MSNDYVDDQLLPMATSFDYWEALIMKERQLKQLYATELMKVKASSEVRKYICNKGLQDDNIHFLNRCY